MKALFRFSCTTLFAFLALPVLAFAKGETTSITLSESGKTVATLNAAAIKEFSFGPGPGNFVGAGAPGWQPKSWIVENWESPVAEPAAQLTRLQATFQLTMRDESTRNYVVFFAFDPATKQGYVYLPGKGESYYDSNVSLMLRGDKYDGHWFLASTEWTNKARAAMEAAGK